MASSTLTIALSEPFKSYVEAHVADGSYDSAADYVEHLILEREPLQKQELQDAITRALAGKRHTITREELEQGNLSELFRSKLNAAE